eukprot:COSAG06_NODE_1109_length_10653_cov_103.721148_3_plen_61_part_00
MVLLLQVKLIKVGDGWIKLTDGAHLIPGTFPRLILLLELWAIHAHIGLDGYLLVPTVSSR